MGWVSKTEVSGKYLVNRTGREVAGLPIEIGFFSSSDKQIFEFYSGGGEGANNLSVNLFTISVAKYE